jgi:diguanylate cyclase (GGDEF)-like protein
MEVNLVCILFLLLISIESGRNVFLLSQRRSFLFVTVSNIVLFTLDIFWIFVDSSTMPVSTSWNWIINASYYIVSGLVGFSWFYYSETIQESKFVNNWRFLVLFFLPELVLIIMTILSYWNHLLFYIDANNVYQRGPAYSLQLVLAYGYVVFTATKAFILSFKAEGYRQKVELRTLATYIIPSIIAGALQVFFPRYPILAVGTTLGILFIFLSRQSQAVAVDMLTGLNNRSQLFQYLSMKMRHAEDNDQLYLLMIDANKFKLINDQYGHLEGDKALKTIADCLKKTCGQKNQFVSRYGGDEFTVVAEIEDKDSIEELAERIKKSVIEASSSYPLSVSVGYAKFANNIKTQQEFIALADKDLYKNKQARN